MDNRKEKLLSLCEKDTVEIAQLVDEIVFIENKLNEIKKLPFHKVHPQDKQKQKLLPAGKLYKELLQQYNSCLKLFASMTGHNMENDKSPLRKWAEEKNVASEQKNMDTG